MNDRAGHKPWALRSRGSENTVAARWVSPENWRYRQSMKLTKDTRLLGMTVGLFISAAVLSAGASSGSPQTSAQAEEPHPPNNARVFASDAGMVLNFIKPEKTADFEAVIAKLRDALQRSDKPERKQQAASWKVFRANEPG